MRFIFCCFADLFPDGTNIKALNLGFQHVTCYLAAASDPDTRTQKPCWYMKVSDNLCGGKYVICLRLREERLTV